MLSGASVKDPRPAGRPWMAGCRRMSRMPGHGPHKCGQRSGL